jgi:iron complex transport system permease protein
MTALEVTRERAAAPAARRAARRPTRGAVLGGLAALCVACALISLSTGALPIPLASLLDLALGRCGEVGASCTAQQEAVIWAIRAPRVALALITGAALASAGCALQGIFRNPLADPGLVGVSSGAMIGAVAGIFALSRLELGWLGAAGRAWLVPGAAFLAGLAAVAVVWRLSARQGRVSVGAMILVGVAINALAGAALGVIIHIADDAELRSLTAWSLGSLGGARGAILPAPLCATLLGLALLIPHASSLNALSLGESAATGLGVPIARVRAVVVGASALMTGASVAFTGLIGFVGLVVPHALRLALGPDHRTLLPASALGGAALLVAADTLGRTIIAPGELPIGVVTALIGAPWFLVMLTRGRPAWSA